MNRGKIEVIFCCMDCGDKISYSSALQGNGRCQSCNAKNQHKQGILNSRGKNNPNYGNGDKLRGKRNPSFIDGRTLKIYKCADCDIPISFSSTRCQKHAQLYLAREHPVKRDYKIVKYSQINFRSLWEANFAKWCDLSGIKWLYESKTFDLGTTTYTPDFYLPEYDCYIEIKGYWWKDAFYKQQLFKKVYKKINLKILIRKNLKELGII